MNTMEDDKYMNNNTIKNAISKFNDKKLQSISIENPKPLFKNFENGMINVNFKIKMRDGLQKMKKKK